MVPDRNRPQFRRHAEANVALGFLPRASRRRAWRPMDSRFRPQAKGVAAHGAKIEMRYSPQGGLLYVTGDANMPGGMTSIGIQSIDVASNEMTGEALSGQFVWWAQPAPAGSVIYAFARSAGMEPTLLQLDPVTLQVTARLFIPSPEESQFYVLAGPAR